MTGIHMESSRNSCCFPYISTFGGTYILHIPSKFNIMNIIIYIIHLKYSILPVLHYSSFPSSQAALEWLKVQYTL